LLQRQLSNPHPATHSKRLVPHNSFSGASLNLDESGSPLTHASALSGPDRELWEQADFEELVRLVTTETIRAIHIHEQPADRRSDTTYYNPQVKEKYVDGVRTRRTRGTAGGDRINYPGEVKANVADLAVVKMLIHSVVSDRAHWMSGAAKVRSTLAKGKAMIGVLCQYLVWGIGD